MSPAENQHIPPPSPASSPTSLTVIGYGTMAQAYVDIWLQQSLISPKNCHLINRIKKPHPKGTHLYTNLAEGLAQAGNEPRDVILLAVKPNQMGDILPPLLSRLAKCPHAPMILTVAAGLRSSYYLASLSNPALVRLMPNLGVRVGLGITGGFALNLSNEQTLILQSLMAPTGMYLPVSGDDDLDIMTGLFGSGPGYIFTLAEVYSQSVMSNLGVDAATAQQLVWQLFVGSMYYALPQGQGVSDGLDFGALVTDMIRIKGTTYAGVKAMEGFDPKGMIESAIQAASQKSRQTGG